MFSPETSGSKLYQRDLNLLFCGRQALRKKRKKLHPVVLWVTKLREQKNKVLRTEHNLLMRDIKDFSCGKDRFPSIVEAGSWASVYLRGRHTRSSGSTTSKKIFVLLLGVGSSVFFFTINLIMCDSVHINKTYVLIYMLIHTDFTIHNLIYIFIHWTLSCWLEDGNISFYYISDNLWISKHICRSYTAHIC